MLRFTITDPNLGLKVVTEELLRNGIKSESRNGPVLRFPEPVTLEYLDPQRRILDWDVRDANHFFHHFETMWMFAGRDDVEPLTFFNSQIAQYSDDGKILKGTAYGKRWRSHFGFDQLEMVINRLREMPNDRRCVLTMWDAQDLISDTQDFACNMQVIFTTRQGEGTYLDMLVTNRSNDLIYGSMGSNLFHFSMLHEYVAGRCGMLLGTYSQMSTNLHLYVDNPASSRVLAAVMDNVTPPEAPAADDSLTRCIDTLPPTEKLAAQAFSEFVDWSDPQIGEGTYIEQIARPLRDSYGAFKKNGPIWVNGPPPKEERIRLAVENLAGIPSPLASAGAAWLQRRL